MWFRSIRTAEGQAAAEKQLEAAIMRARNTGDINKGYATKLKADSGPVVVMDVRTAGIVALAGLVADDPRDVLAPRDQPRAADAAGHVALESAQLRRQRVFHRQSLVHAREILVVRL